MTETEFLNYIANHKVTQVLDVATGHGGFIHALQQWFPQAERYVGIDSLPKAIEHAKTDNGALPKTEFVAMDAHRMTFADDTFDAVSICNSMHHLADPATALKEMVRVLRPGGLLMVYEMVNDNQTSTQMTHVLFHHWWAKVDSRLGISHRETYTRPELKNLFIESGIKYIDTFEDSSLGSDPMLPEATDRFRMNYKQYVDKVKDLPDFQELADEGRHLIERLDRIGVHSATELLLIGEK